ncbi:MAG: A/G-specific adenine glycosylase [Thermoanaerobaculia bacterium]|nr:A/G-specific adenine glycosylase [Thermoanaerobaculia bacterium]
MSEALPETRALLAWYDDGRRDLPWRRTRDHYAVWVSEIMLQQTRVATVIPYYLAFLERFPTVLDLAAAEEDEILALWSGLGYYRRARQMLAAARQVATQGGVFPETSDDLRGLPGIGPYTAAAIASICSGEVIPVLDGNVERVLARRLAMDQDVKRATPRRRLQAEAAALLLPDRPGDSNQALMELGATVCTPRSPDCSRCPLEDGCLGRFDPDRYPSPKKKRKPVAVTRAVAVARNCGGDVLLFRRPDEDRLMAGLWELPQVDITRPNTPAGDVAHSLAEHYGGSWQVEPEVCQVRHGITHRSLTLCIHPARLQDRGLLAARSRSARDPCWVDWKTEKDRYATSSMVEKVLAAVDKIDS